ncbi:MAG TPA: L,D-transpeptidase [Sporichthya sp.]|nr:L,D-transpeptidase [Sporichthya sp.]
MGGRTCAAALAALIAVTALGPMDVAQARPTSPAAPRGAASKAAQVAKDQLRSLGCFIGDASAEGVRFETALIRFQAANGMTQSGDLTKATQRRLQKDNAVPCNDRPVPSHTGKGRRVVMSQGQNWLWIVNKNDKVVAQGGVVDNDWLPQDVYYTGAQCGKPARSRYRTDRSGALEIDWFVRFHDCIVGFHAIPVSKRTGREIHPDYYVGTDLSKSHGCIRMMTPLIKALYDFAAVRTKVVVTR